MPRGEGRPGQKKQAVVQRLKMAIQTLEHSEKMGSGLGGTYKDYTQRIPQNIRNMEIAEARDKYNKGIERVAKLKKEGKPGSDPKDIGRVMGKSSSNPWATRFKKGK